MAKPHEIRHHIAAVEQTRKITGAMEMVSSNRMRRVMSHIEQNNLYFSNVRRTMKEILISSVGISHPYLSPGKGHNPAFIVISGEKGLCGTYNSAVLGYAQRRLDSTPNHMLITIGNTAEDYFRLRGVTPDIRMQGVAQDPTLERTRYFAQDVMQWFESGQADEIHVIYTSFLGATKNMPVELQLLPINLEDYGDVTAAHALAGVEYHPSPQRVFDILVPQYVIGILFGVTVQAYASEHYARMNAMRSATTNAKDMLKDLQTKYNLARQSAITNEIAELASGAEQTNPGFEDGFGFGEAALQSDGNGGVSRSEQ